MCFFLQIEDETQVSRATQGEQDNYEMHVRAANIVSSTVLWAAHPAGALGFIVGSLYHSQGLLTGE